MAKYSLTNAAKTDLLEIARFGDERFGAEQSDRYRDKLKQRFEQIAAMPLMYPSVGYIKEDYRRSVCGAHSIFYRLDEGDVVIVRLLKRQDLQASLA